MGMQQKSFTKKLPTPPPPQTLNGPSLNEVYQLIIYCLNCIRRDQNSTYKTGLIIWRHSISIFGKLSVRQNVFSAKSPFGKMSVGKMSVRRNVRSVKCLSAKCLSAKCLSAKCLSAKYLSAKCLAAKCPGTGARDWIDGLRSSRYRYAGTWVDIEFSVWNLCLSYNGIGVWEGTGKVVSKLRVRETKRNYQFSPSHLGTWSADRL
jgi:hypothetical protein